VNVPSLTKSKLLHADGTKSEVMMLTVTTTDLSDSMGRQCPFSELDFVTRGTEAAALSICTHCCVSVGLTSKELGWNVTLPVFLFSFRPVSLFHFIYFLCLSVFSFLSLYLSVNFFQLT
jgi:hypothetical protein